MILCEIGNTHYHFMQSGRIWKTAINSTPDLKLEKGETIYVVSVNSDATRRLARRYQIFDLEPFVKLDTLYYGLGVDRAVACMAIETGVLVDAGSAITVDIMRDNVHLGGFIYPGLIKFQHMYAQISPRLQKAMNFSIDLECLPQSTADAISYGVITPLIRAVERLARNKPIILTGGDGAYFSRFFEGSIVDNSLIFKGMEKIIKGFEF
ncbi:MAG: type III pantothenate kinase [Helicobacteraceae bacterium]|nr:type III pantothenate kinase [Helicobacteraceae bacterium]